MASVACQANQGQRLLFRGGGVGGEATDSLSTGRNIPTPPKIRERNPGIVIPSCKDRRVVALRVRWHFGAVGNGAGIRPSVRTNSEMTIQYELLHRIINDNIIFTMSTPPPLSRRLWLLDPVLLPDTVGQQHGPSVVSAIHTQRFQFISASAHIRKLLAIRTL